MNENDALLNALQRLVDQQAAYRTEVMAALQKQQRRIVALENLVLEMRTQLWLTFAAVGCIALIFMLALWLGPNR